MDDFLEMITVDLPLLHQEDEYSCEDCDDCPQLLTCDWLRKEKNSSDITR